MHPLNRPKKQSKAQARLGQVLAGWFLLVLIFAVRTGLAAETAGPVKVQRNDKCPVCGMFVAKYPKWVAEIVFKDGSYAVFDGCKDMFKYLFDMGRYNREKTREDIARIYVTEYYSTRILPAREVLYVLGSDVLGPMGHEFIPVQGEENARIFLSDHKGKRVLRFDEITPEDIPR